MNIGYSGEMGKYLIIILSFTSVIVNLVFIWNFLYKVSNNSKSSTEKLMLGLSFAETIISVLWLLSALIIPNKNLMQNKEKNEVNIKCKTISLIKIFFYMFDWFLLSCTIINVKNIIVDPVDSIFKSKIKLIFYFSLSLLFAIIITLLSLTFKLYGISPMITCFFKTLSSDKINFSKKIIYIIISIPVMNLFIAGYNIFSIYKSPHYKNDIQNKIFLRHYLIYFIAYPICAFIIFYLYFYEYFYEVQSQFSNLLFMISTIIICSTPSIIGIIRLIETKILKNNNNDDNLEYIFLNEESTIEENLINKTLDKELTGSFLNFEKSSLLKFIKSIYFSISYTLYNNKTKNLNTKYITKENALKEMKYKINKDTILKNENFKKEIQEFGNSEISIKEYAPEIFNYLRSLDNVNENIIESFLPSKNQQGINSIIKKTEGKGGSIFISTYDNKYVIKSIRKNEIRFLRNFFLEKLANYFSKNRDSIIVKIYGIYKIEIKKTLFSNKNIYLMIMKNVYGVIDENKMAKYDLKGSEFNREVSITEEDVHQQVMKDINFIEYEGVLLLNKYDKKKILRIIERDCQFLCDCQIMDYSLLVVKIGLNHDEIIALFGEKHEENTDKFIQLIQESINNTLNDYDNILLNNDDDKILYNKDNLRFKLEDINFIKEYLFPSLKASNLYILAIIDFLQIYNMQKIFETKFKKIKTDENKISSIPPVPYKNRFITFIKDITNHDKIFK